jgi:hypothetical protein
MCRSVGRGCPQGHFLPDRLIKVKAPTGFCKEIPIWMAEPQSICFCISKSAEINLKAIMRLIELLECSMEDLKF